MRYRTSGVCRISPDVRMRFTAEQAKARAHVLDDVKPIGEGGDFVAVTTQAIEFKAGEVVDLPWQTAPAYLAGVLVPLDPPVQAPKVEAAATAAKPIVAPVAKPVAPIKRA